MYALHVIFFIVFLEIIKRNTCGYAIGGLSGGESKDDFWKIVNLCTDELPKDKPRYLMGVGMAEDLVVCAALGVDMFDCVYPTRTAVCMLMFFTTNVNYLEIVRKIRKLSFNVSP